MSRCFPYPPPAYVRNQVAETEASTKKERELMKKEERKREKKGAQQGGNKLEVSKQSKHAHKKRKHEGISIAGQEMRKTLEESIEQLEKSDLSEEHGAPYSIQASRDSPGSSQGSSKRQKVVLASPSQTKNGNIVRIKLPILHQGRDTGSPATMLEKPRGPEQPPNKQMGPDSSLVKRQNDFQPDINKATTVKPAATPQQSSTQPPGKVMQRLNNVAYRGGQPAAKVMQRIDPQLYAKVAMERIDPPPAKEIQRDAPPSRAKLLQKEIGSTPFGHPHVQHPALPQKPKASVELHVVKRQQIGTSHPKEEPSFSGRNTEAAPVQEVLQSRSDRKKSRKAERKERKFRDLFVTWNPPSLEMEDIDVGDQAWLFDSTRRTDANTSNCRATDGSTLCQSAEQLFSLQPRAIHLTDLHVYQLPYVVPF